MYAPPRPTMTTFSLLAASRITCCVISRTARRVSNTGSALGGVQAEPVSGGIIGSVLAAPRASNSRLRSEPGCSSSASTSSRDSSSRWATSSMSSESRKSALSLVASIWPTVLPPAPICRPMVMTGMACLLILQVVAELLRARRVAQLAQRLGLDLADALAGDAEALAHLFERPLVAVDEPETQLQHTPLSRRERVEDVFDLRVEHGERGGVRRRDGLAVLHEVAEVGVLLLTDRGFERDRVLGDLHDLANFLGRDPHLLADLLVARLAAQLLEQPARDAHQLVDRLHHVHGDADRSRLVGDGARDGLTDPPRRVGRELVALVVVELLDRPDQAHVAFLDQVEERHAAPDVLLGDRHDQPEVRLGQPLLRLVSALVPLGQPVPGDPVGLERFRAHARLGRAVGLAPALRRCGVEQVLELGQVVETEQLLGDMGLLALALHGGQALDDVWQHLFHGTLAAVDLLDHVQGLEGVVQRLGLDGLRQLDLVVRRQQAHPTDLLEVHPDRVVQRDGVHHLDVEEHLVVDLLDLFEILLAVGDLDADLFERGEDPEDLIRLGVDLREALKNVVGREVALLLALDDELLGHGHQLVLELVLRLLGGLTGPIPNLWCHNFGCARDRHPLLSMSAMARANSLPSASESSRIIPLWRPFMRSSLMRSASSTATSSSTLGGGAAQALLIRSCSSAG